MEIEKILEAGLRQGVSDVMLKDGSPPMFRHCGELKRLEGAAPLTTQEVQAALARFLSSDDRRVRFISERHADLAFDEPNVGRFRIHAYRQRGKLGMVLRVIPPVIRRFDELQLPAVVERIANERRGLILVTGPTGSGKTTTLAAIIDYINRTSSRHIITIEDPIEYLHDDQCSVVSQREIGTDADDFVSALRFALRQIPDVIMVGEMRDLETIETAIVAAETGHLVLSTLHTIDAPETINRIVASFPEHKRDQIRTILANVIKGVISQRLVPTVDGQGMAPAVEVMLGTARVREYIDNNRIRELHDAITQGAGQGMQTFDQALATLYHAKRISFDEARLHCSNTADFDLLAQGMGSGRFESRSAVAEVA